MYFIIFPFPQLLPDPLPDQKQTDQNNENQIQQTNNKGTKNAKKKEIKRKERWSLFSVGQLLLGKGLPWAVVDILSDIP